VCLAKLLKTCSKFLFFIGLLDWQSRKTDKPFLA